MTVERALRLIAGAFVMLSVLLGIYVNANFLWFIKFERSFRAAEQGTLPETAEVVAAPQVPVPAQESMSDTANITAFPGITRARSTAKSSRKATANAVKGADDMATVYYLDHFLSLSNR